MSRKDTILISVFINAGLLAVLFIIAIIFRQEPKIVCVEEPAQMEVAKVEPEAEEPFVKLEEQKQEIVHKLPEIAVPVVPQKEEVNHQEIVVQKGDSLEKLAKKYKTTVTHLQESNHLTGSFLKLKQVLKVPIKEEVIKAEEKEQQYYTVKCGDNPWTIAMKHRLKTEELLRLNNLNEERARKLRPGDRLRIR